MSISIRKESHACQYASLLEDAYFSVEGENMHTLKKTLMVGGCMTFMLIAAPALANSPVTATIAKLKESLPLIDAATKACKDGGKDVKACAEDVKKVVLGVGEFEAYLATAVSSAAEASKDFDTFNTALKGTINGYIRSENIVDYLYGLKAAANAAGAAGKDSSAILNALSAAHNTGLAALGTFDDSNYVSSLFAQILASGAGVKGGPSDYVTKIDLTIDKIISQLSSSAIGQKVSSLDTAKTLLDSVTPQAQKTANDAEARTQGDIKVVSFTTRRKVFNQVLSVDVIDKKTGNKTSEAKCIPSRTWIFPIQFLQDINGKEVGVRAVVDDVRINPDAPKDENVYAQSVKECVGVGEVVKKGEVYEISAKDTQTRHGIYGWEAGALLVPAKAFFSKGGGVVSSSSAVAYIGYRIDGGYRACEGIGDCLEPKAWWLPITSIPVTFTPIGFLGFSSSYGGVKDNNGTKTTTNVFGGSAGGGVIFSLSSDKPDYSSPVGGMRFGFLFGWDKTTKGDGYQYNMKPWAAATFGWNVNLW